MDDDESDSEEEHEQVFEEKGSGALVSERLSTNQLEGSKITNYGKN